MRYTVRGLERVANGQIASHVAAASQTVLVSADDSRRRVRSGDALAP